MTRLTSCAWAVFSLVMVMALSGCATVNNYDDLSAVQISALQESNARLDAFDKRLIELDNKLAEGKIHTAVYKEKADELTSLIAEESQFQNAILIRDPKIKIMAQHLLDNIQKAVEATPKIAAVITMSVLEALAGSHATITP